MELYGRTAMVVNTMNVIMESIIESIPLVKVSDCRLLEDRMSAGSKVLCALRRSLPVFVTCAKYRSRGYATTTF